MMDAGLNDGALMGMGPKMGRYLTVPRRWLRYLGLAARDLKGDSWSGLLSLEEGYSVAGLV